MFRTILGLTLGGAVVIVGLWMLLSFLTYVLIPVLGVIGGILGLD